MIKKPNFFILGAAKAGTTSLYNILANHPKVYFPFAKETAFFNDDRFFSKGLDWYLHTYFSGGETASAWGEATPHYLYWSEKTAPRIQAAFGSQAVRLIIILREPVSRAYSWYWNMISEGQEDLSFEDAVEAEPARLVKNHERLYSYGQMTYGYLRGGRYADQIEPFLGCFPRENFLFLLQDDLIHHFNEVANQLISFLDLDPCSTLMPTHSNLAIQTRSHFLQKLLREPSPIKDFIKNTISPKLSHQVKGLALKANSRPFQYPPISKATAMTLKAQFSADNLRLSKIIDRDLSFWNE